MIRCAVAAAVLAAGAAPASANPIDHFGFGARAGAMAGAQTAAGDDTGANYYNPGILATFDTIRIDVGYQMAVPSLRINDADQGVDSARGFVAGLAVPGRLGPDGLIKLAVGGSLFIPDQQVARIRALSSDQPRWVIYDNRPQRVFLGANVAISIADVVYIGGGVAYLSSNSGEVTFDGRVGFPIVEDSDLDIAIDQDLKTIRYPQFGALIKATDWLAFGVSYRDEFQLDVSQQITVQGEIGPEDEPIVEEAFLGVLALSRDLFQPAEITAGVSARVHPRLLASLDVGYHRWSRFENPATNIQIELDAGMFNDLIDLPEGLATFPDPDFHDIIVPRAGIEYLAEETAHRQVHVRAGYSWEPSPAPEQTGESNFVDNDKHTGSIGLGYTLIDFSDIVVQPLSFDAFAAVTYLPERLHRKESPVDPIGDYRAGGAIAQIGLQTRWRF